MPSFTKKAIKESFWKLLNEQPLSQISVKDIVEDCGINRNSFYYHFQDIPSLIEEIILDAANALIKKYPNISSIDECFEAAFRFSQDNKRAILHICNSINRNIYEEYLMKICEYVVSTYFNTVFDKNILDEENKNLFILFTKCELFGLFVDWVNSGMPEDAIDKLKHILYISNGLSDEMIKRCKERSNNPTL